MNPLPMLLALILATSVYTPVLARAAQEAVPVMTVNLAKPTERLWSRTVPASGWLKPWHEAVIAAEVDGLRVTEVLVDIGTVVSQGQPLVRFSDKAVRAELRKEEALAASARADLTKARANADRARRVQPSGALSEEKINEYLIAEQTAVAALESAVASVESLQIKLAQTTVTAVDDGIITSRTAQLGAVVASGAELFRLVRQQRVEWQAEISARDLPLIREGMTATTNSDDGHQISGSVRLVGPTVSTDTGRATVFVALQKDANSPVGLYVTGKIELESTVALTVPETALVVRDGMNYVFTINADNRVDRVRVEVGRRNGRDVEILSGLSRSSEVVASGSAFLSDRAKVRINGSALAKVEGAQQ